MQNRINSLLCATLDGLNSKIIEVEATFTKALPSFSIVGLAGSDIQEAKERVKAALLINGFQFPPLKITINLSPSGIKKSGTHFDLCFALLIAMQKEKIQSKELFVFGELGLDGKVKSTPLIFPLILSLKEQNLIKKAIIPEEALKALSHIPNLELIPVKNISEALLALKGKILPSKANINFQDAKSIKFKNSTYYYQEYFPEDFLDVKGQQIAKRAALIAAVGGHNLLMNGSPGSGKSMIAKRLRWILPPMSEEEILAIAKHQFLDNQTPSFKPQRPFRSPHHTATVAAIFGGGSNKAKIGEVALAHNGILFFDELPYFKKEVLEALREPMQDRVVNITRVNNKISYESDFIFIGAMNPCPCGNLFSRVNSCRCTQKEIKRYTSKLSEPFLDRIDIFVTMQEIEPSNKSTISSKEMFEMVLEAFAFQKKRSQKRLNGKLKESEIDQFCQFEKSAQDMLFDAIKKFGLSHRGVVSIKKVARSIADLNQTQKIRKKDLLEALSYRRR